MNNLSRVIPDCLNLCDRQKKRLQEFVEFIEENVGPANDMHMMSWDSNFWFELNWTGLGDMILAKYKDYTCNLGIDDDGNMSDPAWWQDQKLTVEKLTVEVIPQPYQPPQGYSAPVLLKERIWDGYALQETATYSINDLENQIDAILNDTNGLDLSGNGRYEEIVDFLNDQICVDSESYEGQEDIYTIRVKIRVFVDYNGECNYNFLPTDGKPYMENEK